MKRGVILYSPFFIVFLYFAARPLLAGQLVGARHFGHRRLHSTGSRDGTIYRRRPCRRMSRRFATMLVGPGSFSDSAFPASVQLADGY